LTEDPQKALVKMYLDLPIRVTRLEKDIKWVKRITVSNMFVSLCILIMIVVRG